MFDNLSFTCSLLLKSHLKASILTKDHRHLLNLQQHMGNDNEEYSKLLITILFSSLMKKNYCIKLKNNLLNFVNLIKES